MNEKRQQCHNLCYFHPSHRNGNRGLLFPKVLSEAGLQARSDLPVLVSITRLPTDDVRRKRKIRIVTNLVASSLSVMVLVAAMLFYG